MFTQYVYILAEVNMNLENYKNNYSEILTFLNSLSTDQINFKPAKDKWSIHEIITHLADTEIQSHVRFRTILANKDPQMPYFNEMDWSIILDYTKVNLNESLEVINLMRTVNYNLLSRLPSDYFDKKGRHSKHGEISLKDMVEFYIQHVNTHLNQLKRNLSLLKAY